jgi:hypothetical protein
MFSEIIDIFHVQEMTNVWIKFVFSVPDELSSVTIVVPIKYK